MSKQAIPVLIPGVDLEIHESEIETMQPPIELQSTAIQTTVLNAIVDRSKDDRIFLPENKPLPTHHVKREIMPCPKCRRLRMDDMNQATVCNGTQGTIAFYRCRSCQHRWKMPVKNP